MLNFKKRTIKEDRELISQELKRIREEKGIKLSKAAADLRISEKYLASLESGNIGDLPEGVYGRNFLKRYAEYLGLESGRIAGEYFHLPADGQKDNKELFVRKVPSAFYFLTIPRLLKNLALFFLALALVAYLGYAVYNIISPPFLAVNSPGPDYQTKESSLLVVGQTEPEASVHINGEAVLVDEDGNFQRAVNLQTGINSIIISAQKKYSRIRYITRKILVEEK